MLPQLQAERRLAAIEASAMPHMSVTAQQNILRRLQTLAFADVKPVKPTTSDLAAIGIQVERVDAEGVPVTDGTSSDDMGGDG